MSAAGEDSAVRRATAEIAPAASAGNKRIKICNAGREIKRAPPIYFDFLKKYVAKIIFLKKLR